MSATCDHCGTAPAAWYVAVTNTDGVKAELRSRWSCAHPDHLRQAKEVVGHGGREFTVTAVGDESAAVTTPERFETFHRTHPHVYQVLVRLAREWVARTGRRKVGIAILWERMRWELAVQTNEAPKLNNDYRAYYSRLIMANEPDLSELFEVRRSAADEALGLAA